MDLDHGTSAKLLERPVVVDINPSVDADDLEWAQRSEYWLQQLQPTPSKSNPKRREHLPLILAGHGVRMNVENGTLKIRNGRTHHPQNPEEWRLFRGDRFLPSRVIMLDGDGHLTFDVLAWLSEQKIPLIQIDWMGSVVTVAGGTGFSADRNLAAAQISARQSDLSMRIAIDLVRQKLHASILTLKFLQNEAPLAEAAAEYLDAEIQKLVSQPPETVGALLGLEGRVAAQYFGAWRDLLLRWKGIGARPVPPDWHRIGSRLSPLSKRNRYAVHPVNAMLNYGYSMLENQVRVEVVAAGLDPTIGCLHSSYDDQHALIFDLMEPLRPIVDRRVLELVHRHTFTPGDFTLTVDGICRLNPQLARVVMKRMDLAVEIATVVREYEERLL